MGVKISLTTIPERIIKIENTIKSLLSQDLIVDINLYIPIQSLRSKAKFNIEKIPEFLKNDRIKVIVKDNDIGSIMKVFYCLKDNPDDYIITADDDVIYPKNWASTLYKNALLYKEENIPICFRGRNFTSKEVNYKKTKVVNCNIIKNPTSVDIITGTWGAIYKKDIFPEEFFDFKVGLFSRIDDIWITGMLWKNKKKGLVLPFKGLIKPTEVANINSLWQKNSTGTYNNQGLNEFKEYYF